MSITKRIAAIGLVAVLVSACAGAGLSDPGEETALPTPDVSGLTNTYTTSYIRYGDPVTCPVFEFDYPDGWEVTTVESDVNSFSDREVLTNDRGVSITFMEFASDMPLGGYGRFMSQIEVAKVADASFVPGVPAGTPDDFSELGNFVVAELKVVGELFMDTDVEFTPVEDGGVFYAVVPDSYIGEHEVIGPSGIYEEFSFNYPGPYSIIAEAPEGHFTEDEAAEVIAILSTFRSAD